MSKQDQVVDDDEPETCPLCIEELDLSDRGFYPCPCGYQICQFCYNNIKTTMNGLCPACRRTYDDANIKFEAPSPEEVAKYKENRAQQDKKKAAAKRQEAASRQADNLSRKHLAGIRVRRHNLVYVTGLHLNTSHPRLSEMLRGEQYFGQYGKIDKIVVNKPKDSRSVQQVGIYITYFDKESASLCISMVNGSQNNGVTIRADYGTTKYCSAFLRHETCTNKNCTFLHEVGDDNESFTREGLSSLNAISSQSAAHAPSSTATQQPLVPPQTQQQPQQQPALTASQSMDRQDSRNETASPVESTDSSALPSSASWANKESSSRRPSQTQSVESASPSLDNATPMPPANESEQQDTASKTAEELTAEESQDASPQDDSAQSQPPSESQPLTLHGVDPDVRRLRTLLTSDGHQFVFDDSSISAQDLELLRNFPLLFDPNGGPKRYAAQQREAERRRLEKDQQVASQALSAMDLDETAEGGSLQLGGEPEDRQEIEFSQQQHHAIRPPSHDAMRSPTFGLNSAFSQPSQSGGLAGRSPLPQQQQQLLLQRLKSGSPNLLNQGSQPGQFQQSTSLGPGSASHSRQASRFSFANDSASATASVKPVTNPKVMSQQSSMMPPPQTSQYNPISQHQTGAQFFTSGVQGPPPGLKATGTPPVSGGGMFGQGHGFATAGLGYGVNATGRNANDDMMRELLRNRGGSAGSGQTSEGGRREFMFPSSHQHSQVPSPVLNPGLSSFPYGSRPGAFQDLSQQKQKKRGKKHRHANTSSSGGGVVDLADPSILQARMHQAGGAGQGHFGAQGQGQGGFNNSMMYGNSGFGRW